jgi:uncharacterized protein (TIGR02266 family)
LLRRIGLEVKKLLLVDDVELFLHLERTILKRKSFSISTAKSGTEALESVRKAKPDLILLDMFMPDINGDEVCRILKSDPETMDIPIIIVTMDSKLGSKEKCIEAGCDGFIYKPINKNVLIATVEEHLGIRKRYFRRVPTKLQCDVSGKDIDVSAFIHNLSQTGAFIAMDIVPEIGEEQELEFTLPGADEPINTQAKVRWVGYIDEEGTLGAGVEFSAIEEGESALIRAFIDGLLSGPSR